MICTKCGGKISDGAAFCPYCGAAAPIKSDSPKTSEKDDRDSIKARTKEAVGKLYWPAVLLTVLAAAPLLLGQGPAILLLIFAGLPFLVGIAKAQMRLFHGERYDASDLFSGFSDYKKNIGAMALKFLFLALGIICLIVPGLIAALGMFEVRFLLAEGTPLSGMDVIRKSREDMRGHKRELFRLILPYIGWALLSIPTLGALWAFYAGPRFYLDTAGFYCALKEKRKVA